MCSLESLWDTVGGPEKGRLFDVSDVMSQSLSTESIQGASLPLECVDYIHGGDRLPLGMLSVGDSIPDDILQENLKNTPRLLVDKA